MIKPATGVAPRLGHGVVLTRGSLRVESISNLESLASHATAWDRLALQLPQKLPMTSYAWVASDLERGSNRGKPWVCLLAFENSRLVGVLPVLISTRRLLGMRFSTAFLLPTRTCSGDIVTPPGREEEVIPILLRALERAVPSWCCLKIARLPEESRTVSFLMHSDNRLYPVRDLDGHGAFLVTRGEFQSYLGGLSPHFARNLRRLEKKAMALPGAEFVSIAGGAATEDHLAMFMEMEGSGWKSSAGSAINQSPERVAFYRALARRLAERGGLQWHFLRAQGRLLAGQMATRVGRSLVLLKIAFDEAYSAYAPGNVLLLNTIRRAFESADTEEINCLTDYPWTRNWNMQSRAHYNYWVYRRAFLPMTVGVVSRKAWMTARGVPWLRALFRRIHKSVGSTEE